MRLLRCLSVSGSAAVLAGTFMLAGQAPVPSGPGAAAVPARAASPRGTSRPPSAAFLAQARRALTGYLRRGHSRIGLVHPREMHTGAPTVEVGTTRLSSYNWSGYADVSATSQTFSSVSGEWRTPTMTCSREDTITSEWVGLDGFNSPTVEQAGTVGWCFEGTPTYFTWYEMYPSGTVEVGTSLRPGDKVTATVSRGGTSYTLALTDATHAANSFSVTKPCPLTTCLDTSAEWVAERPSFQIGIAPLADYHRWTVHNASVTANGTAGTISSYRSSYKINMMDATGSYQLSTTSYLVGGRCFSDYWLGSY